MSSWWMVVPITIMLAPFFRLLFDRARRSHTPPSKEDSDAFLALLQANGPPPNPYATKDSKPCPKCGCVGHTCPNFVPPPPVWDHENEDPLYPPW